MTEISSPCFSNSPFVLAMMVRPDIGERFCASRAFRSSACAGAPIGEPSAAQTTITAAERILVRCMSNLRGAGRIVTARCVTMVEWPRPTTAKARVSPSVRFPDRLAGPFNWPCRLREPDRRPCPSSKEAINRHRIRRTPLTARDRCAQAVGATARIGLGECGKGRPLNRDLVRRSGCDRRLAVTTQGCPGHSRPSCPDLIQASTGLERCSRAGWITGSSARRRASHRCATKPN